MAMLATGALSNISVPLSLRDFRATADALFTSDDKEMPWHRLHPDEIDRAFQEIARTARAGSNGFTTDAVYLWYLQTVMPMDPFVRNIGPDHGVGEGEGDGEGGVRGGGGGGGAGPHQGGRPSIHGHEAFESDSDSDAQFDDPHDEAAYERAAISQQRAAEARGMGGLDTKQIRALRTLFDRMGKEVHQLVSDPAMYGHQYSTPHLRS